MIGYLVYHPKEAEKNQAFIRLFEEEGKKESIFFSYVSHEQYQLEPLPDFVLNRTRSPQVSMWYEKRHIPVFHSAFLTELGNHKMKTLEFLERHLPEKVLCQKWAPDSVFLSAEQVDGCIRRLKQFQGALTERMQYQVLESVLPGKNLSRFWDRRAPVIKSVDGHGGTEVEMLPLSKILPVLQRFSGKDCILQEQIPSEGKDLRIYVLGNQIYQAVCRQGRKDFRSNYSLGGTAAVYALSKKEREWIQFFLQAFHRETLGLAGLDFIIDTGGRLIFNELEEMAGCRMLYRHTECNIVRDYVVWLKKNMENKGCHKGV